MADPAAPFDAALADSPPGARAWWVRADDGLRVRIAHFPASDAAEGTVLLFPGRTEYVEKYGRTGADLVERGYHVLTIDWRGQGLADRMLEDARTGHVQVFEDYQRDVAAMLDLADRLGLPRPLHLIGHSMGGCIGLRAVMDGLPVASCVFTGPMWGIRIAGPIRPAAWALGWGGRRMGLGHLYAPGTTSESYVATGAFEDNTLTRDREMWDYMRAQVQAHPGLQLGGPSLTWLHEALAECLALSRRPSPRLPCLCLLGENERIVDTGRIQDRMARWPDGDLEIVPHGEHEVLMEDRATRTRLADRIAALFRDAATGQRAQPRPA